MHTEFTKYLYNLPEASLPPLDFSYSDVSGIMSEEMLDLHYKHLHQGYIDRYNKAVSEEGIKSISMEKKHTEKEKVILFNLGGYINHAFFWKSFSPRKEDYEMSKDMQELVQKTFKNINGFTEEVLSLLPKIRGSGWIWLVYLPCESSLRLEITMNQDFVLTNVPLLNIDLWEHAYYLQYKVDKVTYVKSLIGALNWKFASIRLNQAKKM